MLLFSPISRHFWVQKKEKKMSEKGETIKNLNMGENDKIRFLPFLDTFESRYKRKSVQNQEKQQKCLEMGEIDKVNFLLYQDTFGRGKYWEQ